MSDQTATQRGLDRSLVRIACILAIGSFAALLDATVVGVAVHTLTVTFSASLADTQWATTAYLLALSAVIPATGWAAQRFGATATWIASLSVFLAGSVLCGLAWSLGSLIVFRVAQGAGAGMLFPLMRIIVVEVAGRDRLGRMMALIAIPIQLAPIAGPIVGGAAIEGLSWRWAFFINVPIVLVTIILSAIYIPNSRGSERQRLDLVGLLGVSGGLTLLILALVRAGEHASGASDILLPLLGALLLLGFHGVRTVRAKAPGILEFGLFRDRSFAASSSLAFLNNFGLFAAVFLVPLFFQQGAGDDPLKAGLALAPQGLGMLVAVLAVGRLVDIGRNARSMVMGGLLLAGLGTLPFAFVTSDSVLVLSIALFFRGVGMAFAVAPTMITLYHSLPGSKVPAATTVNAVAQQVGAAAGTACIAVALQQFVTAKETAVGFHWAFWLTVGFVAVTFVPALFLPTGRRPDSSAAPARELAPSADKA